MSQFYDVSEVGRIGVVSDMPYSEVPPNAWTNAQNVRMYEDQVISFPGHINVGENTALTDIWGLIGATTANAHYWVHLGPDSGNNLQAYIFDGTNFIDISPDPPVTALLIEGGKSDIISLDILNQNVIFTNYVNEPLAWDISPSNKFVSLPGWDENWRCRMMRAFKGFLLAIDMKESGADFPYRVRWSDQAAPGGLPPNWDATDATSRAGFQDLGDTTTFLLGGLPLRDTFVIYTNKDTIGAQFIGGEFVFRFYTISRQSGLLASRSVSTVRGQHIALTDGDFVSMNGQAVETLIDRKMRSWLFNQIDQDNLFLAFTYVNQNFNEVWACFPGQGMDYCNLALVWNWRTGSYGVRELPFGCIAAAEVIDIVGVGSRPTWADYGGTWAEAQTVWDTRTFDATQNVPLLGGRKTGSLTGAPLFRAEVGNTFAGTPKTSRVEKLGIRLAGDQRFVVDEIWPRATGGPFTVQIGSQEVPNGPVRWQVTRTFNPQTDKKITCRVTGRYGCIAFESQTDVAWRLQGYSARFRERGLR